MTKQQKAICDGFVYVRQHGGTASLNVAVASALCMHHFALWAGYEERAREGEKYVDDAGRHRRRPGRGEARRAAAREAAGRTWRGRGRVGGHRVLTGLISRVAAGANAKAPRRSNFWHS